MRKSCGECANYDHKNMKHTVACGNCVVEHYSDGSESDPSSFRALPQTNADRIRAMSDEKLAHILGDKCMCPTDKECGESHGNCDACWLKWLKQPAEVEK